MSAIDYSNAVDRTTLCTMQRIREQTAILGSMNKILGLPSIRLHHVCDEETNYNAFCGS
ncbi:hypothetical protein V1524DRAFT_441518 [Lipomyces starkeyi]